MNGYSTLSLFLSLLVVIYGQRFVDERDLPPESIQAASLPRLSKHSFDTQYHRGRCPDRFYQVGEECLYFATDGKIYAWEHVQPICERRIARLLGKTPSSPNQPNMVPTRGVRQLILNTPEKTKILEALYRDYNELNFAVRLPADYNTLHRCRDDKHGSWPHYCSPPTNPNVTCVETSQHDHEKICLLETECTNRYSRVACEFTLPGSSELTASTFRHCAKSRGFRNLLPFWAWILVIVGALSLLLLILGAVLSITRKAKRSSTRTKKALPEPRTPDDNVIRVSTVRDDPAAEPMLVRAAPSPPDVSDSGYLQPRALVPPATVVKQDDTANV